MALLSFPTSPTNGQLYPTSPISGQNQYEWDSANQTWRLLGTATAVIPGTYGDATNVGQFTVDAQGRLTSAVNVPISATIPDLQIVTDQGAVTTNVIDVAGLIAAGLTYPAADGAANDVLVTDGAGNLSFVTPTVEDLQSVTDNGATTTNAIDVAGLTSAGLIYPLADGTANDVLVTDGAGALSFSALPTETLQSITDNGATTTNAIDVAGLTAAGLTYPAADGLVNDVLVTDGAGALSFSALPTETLQSITDNGTTTTNSIDVAGLTAAGLVYPLTDGTADQVVATDGAGNLGWLSTLKLVTAPTASTDGGALGQVAVSTGFFYFFDGTQWLQVAGVTF